MAADGLGTCKWFASHVWYSHKQEEKVLKTDLKFIQLYCVTAGACSWPQNYLGLFHLVVEKSQLASQLIQPLDLSKAQQTCERAHLDATQI